MEIYAKRPKSATADLGLLVGVSGFEPEASWTRTKRDTKLRHTPITRDIIVNFSAIVKCGRSFIQGICIWIVSYTVPEEVYNELLC